MNPSLGEPAPTASDSAWGRITRFVVEQRWPLALFVAALIVRLHWNLVVHPPGDYIYSDMRGYIVRAEGLFTKLGERHEYAAFYPYGTHWLLFLAERVFGRANYPALGALYAVLGAGVVPIAYALGRRVSPWPFVPAAVGLLLVLYYPLLSLGGYFLSETPFSLLLCASTLMLVRTVQDGRARDAWLTGVLVALAMLFRPQILLSAALVGVAWLFGRRAMPKFTFRRALAVAVPVVVVLGFSAARLHYHTGRYGLLSENGTFNQVFGRCHNNKITAHPDTPARRRTSFGPPPLIQLDKRDAQGMPWPHLDPALDEHIEYEGYIGDAEVLRGLMKRCIEKTGWLKQAEYGLVNALMLWRYNVMWPDSGRRDWIPLSRAWGLFVLNAFAVPTMLGLVALARFRRNPALGLVVLHVIALVVVAALYFGDVRLRAPYDPMLLVVAVHVYVALAAWIWRSLRKTRGGAQKADVGLSSP